MSRNKYKDIVISMLKPATYYTKVTHSKIYSGISDKQFTSEMNNVHPTTRNTPVRSPYSTLFSTDTSLVGKTSTKQGKTTKVLADRNITT